MKQANKQYSHLKNDYELTFNHDTQVVECLDGNIGVPEIKYDFVKIKNIAEKETNSFIGECLTTKFILHAQVLFMLKVFYFFRFNQIYCII